MKRFLVLMGAGLFFMNAKGEEQFEYLSPDEVYREIVVEGENSVRAFIQIVEDKNRFKLLLMNESNESFFVKNWDVISRSNIKDKESGSIFDDNFIKPVISIVKGSSLVFILEIPEKSKKSFSVSAKNSPSSYLVFKIKGVLGKG